MDYEEDYEELELVESLRNALRDSAEWLPGASGVHLRADAAIVFLAFGSISIIKMDIPIDSVGLAALTPPGVS
jgi:hypothetical protein